MDYTLKTIPWIKTGRTEMDREEEAVFTPRDAKSNLSYQPTTPNPKVCLQNGIPIFLCDINNLPPEQSVVLRLLLMKIFCPLLCGYCSAGWTISLASERPGTQMSTEDVVSSWLRCWV